MRNFPPFVERLDGALPLCLFGAGAVCGFYLFGGVQFFVDGLHDRVQRKTVERRK